MFDLLGLDGVAFGVCLSEDLLPYWRDLFTYSTLLART